MNQDIEEVVAERVLLSQLVVQRKTQTIDVAIADTVRAGIVAEVFY